MELGKRRFKTISGILSLTKGSVTIDGVRSDTIKAYQIVEKGVSLVPEGRRLFRDMTVLENLELAAISEGTTTEDENLKWIFQMFRSLINAPIN